MKKIITILFSIFTLSGFSQTPNTVVKFVNSTSVATPNGYSTTVQIDLGNASMILISGQVPLDKQGNLIGKGDFAKQVEQTFSNIRNIIEEAGGTMSNVVKINNYITDMSQIQIFRDIRDKFINKNNPPASTLIQVSKLFRDDVMVEIEATAIIPKK